MSQRCYVAAVLCRSRVAAWLSVVIWHAYGPLWGGSGEALGRLWAYRLRFRPPETLATPNRCLIA
eukprot:2170660-Alexandrium_andersonii.AAC.1